MGYRTKKINRSSSSGKKEYYLQEGFWLKPENHYWENDTYTEAGKQELRKFVDDERKKYKQSYYHKRNRNHI